jgi:hypothetical protein
MKGIGGKKEIRGVDKKGDQVHKANIETKVT